MIEPELLKNEDRPAFPTNGRMHSEMVGLSKREEIAARVLSGLVTGYAANGMTPTLNPEYTAKTALLFADELLKQLER